MSELSSLLVASLSAPLREEPKHWTWPAVAEVRVSHPYATRMVQRAKQKGLKHNSEAKDNFKMKLYHLGVFSLTPFDFATLFVVVLVWLGLGVAHEE